METATIPCTSLLVCVRAHVCLCACVCVMHYCSVPASFIACVLYVYLCLDDEARAYVPQKLEGEDSLSHEFRKQKAYYYFDKMGLQATP